MEVVHSICSGLDVHRDSVVACLRICKNGEVTTHRGHACPIVLMESTGIYWKPIYHVLVTSVEIVVGNARDIHQVPGKKTDKADAVWLSELLAHDLVRPSFIPCKEISALRELTQ